jgi:hypothetical protein
VELAASPVEDLAATNPSWLHGMNIGIQQSAIAADK